MGESGQRAQGGGCADNGHGLRARFVVWFGPLLRIAHVGSASAVGSNKWMQRSQALPALADYLIWEGCALAGILALDLHKEYIYGYQEHPGEKARRFRYANGREQWRDLARKHVDSETRVVFEATGGAFALYDILSPLAKDVVVANPLELKRYGSGRHTDKVDVERMAGMLMLGTVPQVWVPPQMVREVRQLLNYRDSLVRQEVAMRNRAKMALLAVGVVLPRGKDPITGLGEAFSTLPRATQVVVASAMRKSREAEEEAQAILAEIEAMLKDDAMFQAVLSLQGIGRLTAAVVWATIGDPARFATKKQVTRYVGFDPTVFQSGETNHNGHISRHGPSLVRKYAVEAVRSIIRSGKGPFFTYYQHLREIHGHSRAAVATARKLVIAAWTLMREQRPATEVDQRKYQAKIRKVEREACPYPVSVEWARLMPTLDQAG